MVLDLRAVFMDQVDGEGAGNSVDLLEPHISANLPKAAGSSNAKPCKRSKVVDKQKTASHNGLPAQSSSSSSSHVAERRSSSALRGRVPHRPPLCRPLSLDMTPQHLRGPQGQTTERRLVQPPWRSCLAAPSPPARSLTSPSLGAGGWMRRSESTCSVNYSLGRQAGRGGMRPATSLPHIAKGAGASSVPTASKPCLLVALRPLNLEQEKQIFFESDFKYEPQFEYMQPEPRGVLEKYGEGSGLFLEQVCHRAPVPLTRTPVPCNMSMMMTVLCWPAGGGNHGVCPEEVWLL